MRASLEAGKTDCIVASMHRAPLLDAVCVQVVGQRAKSVFIPLARMHVLCAGMDKVRQSKVSDSRVEVNNCLQLAIQARHTRFLGTIARAEHRTRDVKSKHNAKFLRHKAMLELKFSFGNAKHEQVLDHSS